MLTIVAKFTVKEDKLEEFINSASGLAAESRKEEGCISYDIFRDINDPAVITFIEAWKDKEAHAFHEKTSHFRTISARFGEMLQKGVEVNFYNQVK